MTTASLAPGVAGLLTPLQDFLDDVLISEISINRPKEVFIEKDGRMIRFDMPMLTSAYLRRLFVMIANDNQQTLSEHTPLLSGNLPCGARVQLVVPPASRHETLSIRKFVTTSLGLNDFIIPGSFKHDIDKTGDELQSLYRQGDWLPFLKLAITSRKNIIISGATSSGKTTFLNTCLSEIPFDERLIILEDTYEIITPHPNVVRLKSTPNLTMQDLVQASLRLRPDRLIMGEIRGREIFDFISACSTGHNGALTTLHANNPKIAFMRMAQLYKLNNVPGMTEADIYRELHEVIDVIVQLQKTKDGRRLTEVYYKDA